MDFFSREKAEFLDLSRPILVSLEAAGGLLKDSKPINKNGDRSITLMHFDTLSRNKALYPQDDLVRSFNESRYVQENIAQRTWFGENEHPAADAPLARFMFVEPSRWAWLIKSYSVSGDKMNGVVSFVPPMGTMIEEIIDKHGSNWAASIRAYTPNFVKKEGPQGQYVIKKYPMFPVTYDAVTTPGLYAARMSDPDSFKTQNLGREGYAASYKIFKNPAEDMRQILSSQESARVVQDMFNIDFSKSKYLMSKDGRVEFRSEEGIKVNVPLNLAIINKALNTLPRK